MICDGAKPSCAMKLTSGVSTAVLSAMMAMDGHCVTPVEVIIEEAVFEKVQQVRQQRHRNTRTGRSSIFSGLVYCADCGEKLY